ncbi:MAG: phage tail sheath subtilisin-like domain-containing protein [Proteobacteria bacterium]|nr:phage tail sheath subtilisin-like domain-containing protein [Pseudomonadota bacterium]
MAERLTPGVYVEEKSGGVRPIQGVSTSTVGFIGVAPRGIPNVATFINGFGAYQRLFGPHQRGEAGFLAQAVDSFFEAGGRRAFVVRVVPQNALQGASLPLRARAADAWGQQRDVLQFNAIGVGAWANSIRIHVESSTSFQDAAFAVRVESVENGKSQTLERFDNVRMDPESEDYVGTVINDTSRYITVTDLLQVAFDADPQTVPPLPERAAELLTRPASGPYTVPEGARIEFRWRDNAAAGSDDHLVPVTFDNAAVTAAGGSFSNGRATLTAQQLGQILTAALGSGYRVTVPQAPAQVASNNGPFNTTGGTQSVVQIDGAATNLVYTAASAATMDLGAGPFGGLAAGQTLTLTVDGGTPQSYNLQAGDIGGGGTPAELAVVLNREFTGIQAFVAGANLTVRTDRRGASSTLAITGSAAAGLGSPGAQAGAGNVADPAAVTPQELAAVFNTTLGAGAAFEARVQDSHVVFTQINTAASHTIQWVSDPGPATIVADTTLHTGPAIPAAGAQVSIQPAVATRAYRVIRTPAPGGSFAAGGTARTVAVAVTSGGNTETFQVAIPQNETRTPTALAEAFTAVIDGAPANTFHLEAVAAGDTVVFSTGRVAGGVTIAATVNGAAIWAGEQGRAGAAGTVVDSQSAVEISASEPFRPGVARVLNTLLATPRATGLDQDSALDPNLRPNLTEDTPLRLLGGTDGSGEVGVPEYTGDVTPTGQRTGMRAFDTADINILVMPGRNDPGFVSAASAYCDLNDVFLILDGVGSIDREFSAGTDDVRQFVESLPARSNNAAMYYPWVRVPDPVGVGRNPTRFVPPSGHMAGIFARTDNTRGVWKAPAGIESTVSGAIALQHDLLDADQDLLNPIGLNCIRQFPGTGIISWGSRTLAADPQWRYVPVRRTALFLKQSVKRGLKWAVFEPNDATLWEQIRTNIDAFMRGLFRQGAFQGATPDEAFAVQCDRETNPQELVDQGIVTARLAFAPLKPAEFVVIEISQKTLLTA